MFTFWCLVPLFADGILVITQDEVAAAYIENPTWQPDGDPWLLSLSGFT